MRLQRQEHPRSMSLGCDQTQPEFRASGFDGSRRRRELGSSGHILLQVNDAQDTCPTTVGEAVNPKDTVRRRDGSMSHMPLVPMRKHSLLRDIRAVPPHRSSRLEGKSQQRTHVWSPESTNKIGHVVHSRHYNTLADFRPGSKHVKGKSVVVGTSKRTNRMAAGDKPVAHSFNHIHASRGTAKMDKLVEQKYHDLSLLGTPSVSRDRHRGLKMSPVATQKACVAKSKPPASSEIKPYGSRTPHIAVDKSHIVAQEIARHDFGPYPVGMTRRRQIKTASSSLQPCANSRRPIRQQIAPSGFQGVRDRDVLRGLHVAAAAACDEKLADAVLKHTGVHVRQFLSALVHFESLGLSAGGADFKQRATCRGN
jgi:hypothetical protein